MNRPKAVCIARPQWDVKSCSPTAQPSPHFGGVANVEGWAAAVGSQSRPSTPQQSASTCHMATISGWVQIKF
jgi:hypothetical protein